MTLENLLSRIPHAMRKPFLIAAGMAMLGQSVPPALAGDTYNYQVKGASVTTEVQTFKVLPGPDYKTTVFRGGDTLEIGHNKFSAAGKNEIRDVSFWATDREGTRFRMTYFKDGSYKINGNAPLAEDDPTLIALGKRKIAEANNWLTLCVTQPHVQNLVYGVEKHAFPDCSKGGCGEKVNSLAGSGAHRKETSSTNEITSQQKKTTPKRPSNTAGASERTTQTRPQQPCTEPPKYKPAQSQPTAQQNEACLAYQQELAEYKSLQAPLSDIRQLAQIASHRLGNAYANIGSIIETREERKGYHSFLIENLMKARLAIEQLAANPLLTRDGLEDRHIRDYILDASVLIENVIPEKYDIPFTKCAKGFMSKGKIKKGLENCDPAQQRFGQNQVLRAQTKMDQFLQVLNDYDDSLAYRSTTLKTECAHPR